VRLALFKSLWGHARTLEHAIVVCQEDHMAGIEGPAPASLTERRQFQQKLDEARLSFIAEICTAGSYVPERNSPPATHLESLRRQAEKAIECHPLFLTVLAGCDAWPVSQSVDFFGRAAELEREFGVPLSFETHRGRSFFNPWTTREILNQLPLLKLTCDFSHWCVVCERLIDTEPDILQLCAERAHHIHARVGYAQGPQVPHPAAPEYTDALVAHERWWLQIWKHQLSRGFERTTMTPEFGPDGYLHTLPYSRMPVADLASINRWMADRQRERFNQLFP
jgi:hypothetical protein